MRDKVIKFLVKIDAMSLFPNHFFGTLLRQLSINLGITFDNSRYSGKDRKISFCQDISNLEHSVHKVLNKMANQMGINVSLLDLPKYYKVSTSYQKQNPLRKDQPFYSLCSANISTFGNSKFLPFCPLDWYHGSKEYITKNPYNDKPESFCSGGINNCLKASL